jgi:UDP-N-acetylglucosamine/UDP-N-acetylgalactosamine diphosphorylase
MDERAARKTLEQAGQQQVLGLWPRLNASQRDELLADIAAVDWPQLAALVRDLDHPAAAESTADLTPPESIRAQDSKRADVLQAAADSGRRRLAAGQVAALTVAGGQGTRLGFAGPKGMFPITPVRRKSLFQLFAEGILAARRRWQARIPWYVMTSRENDAPTRRFFDEHGFFGLPAGDVTFFVQGVMPAVDERGRVLLAEPHRLALTPDGHGGTLRALQRSGALAGMRAAGITCVSYFQVDNPLVSVLDPVFIGLLDAAGSEAVSKAVTKAYDGEKVGVFVNIGGRLQVMEYSDMPQAVAHSRRPDGGLRFDQASIAVHAFDRGLLERLSGGSEAALPYHRARKPVACVDPASGRAIDPPPAAVKFEQFIFDCLPRARQPLVYEVRREDEFAPVKNAAGVDSPDTSRAALSARAAAWLRAAGQALPDGAAVEISPLLALDEEELRAKLASRPPVAAEAAIYLE